MMTGTGKPTIKIGERPSVKYAAYSSDVMKKDGKEAVSLSQRELGTKFARSEMKKLRIRGKSARAAGAVYATLLRELSIKYSIIEDTDRRFILHTTDCPFLEEWKAKGADVPEMCESFGKSFVQGLCDGVNPKLRYSVTRMMSRGSPFCEEKIELGT